MSLLKRILAVLVLLGAISIVFFLWYLQKHKMEEAQPFEINTMAMEKHMLIATQGSEFKNAVVEGVIAQLKPYDIFIKVIDVSQLPNIKEQDWSAIVILHTWEYSKAQKDAQRFVETAPDKNKIVALSTSGGGAEKIAGIDGVTSASQM
ncbi:MAG: hypothetical protein K2U26_20360, partial [Cyclobacteriaceae bacterium]|nr:hypothetical protein [Cyclobacteriaceae bacterium]